MVNVIDRKKLLLALIQEKLNDIEKMEKEFKSLKIFIYKIKRFIDEEFD